MKTFSINFLFINIQGVPKKGTDKKTFILTCSLLQFTVLNLFGFSIFVSFVCVSSDRIGHNWVKLQQTPKRNYLVPYLKENPLALICGVSQPFHRSG